MTTSIPDPLPFASSLPDIAWPATVSPRGMAVLSLLFQLERTERWPARRLRDFQRAQLQRLVAHAAANVPFYRDRLAPLAGTDGEAFWAAWQRLPLLTRAEVQQAGDDLLCHNIPEGHGGLSEIFTSGSTGRPVRVLRTELSELYWSAVTVRDHLWHGRDLCGKLAAIRNSTAGNALYPEGERLERWGFLDGGDLRDGAVRHSQHHDGCRRPARLAGAGTAGLPPHPSHHPGPASAPQRRDGGEARRLEAGPDPFGNLAAGPARSLPRAMGSLDPRYLQLARGWLPGATMP